MNITTLAISIIIVVVLAASVFHSMWNLSKKLVIPMQICLFILLVVMLFKTFFTKENFNLLNKQVEKSGIVNLEEKAIKDSAKAVSGTFQDEDKSTTKDKQSTLEKKSDETKKEDQNTKKDKPDFIRYMEKK